MTEIQNPFRNGKLVATDYDSRLYHMQTAKRGDKDYVMSRSELVEFAKCPSRWIRGFKDAEDGTDSTDWGSMVDALLLDKHAFFERFAIKPETYPAPASHAKVKAGKMSEGDPLPWNGNAGWCENWLADQGDKIPISHEKYGMAKTAAERIINDDTIGSILDNCQVQVYCTADYKDRDTGLVVPIKVLIDIVPGDGDTAEFSESLIDFKTASSANPLFWPKVVHNMGYDVQAALFMDVYNAATSEERIEFRHIVQENYAPYEISKPILSTEFLELGRNKYLNALRRYADCLQRDIWPGYDEMSQTALNGWPLMSPDAWMVAGT